MEEMLKDFLKDYGYERDPNVEGVVFYGSYQTKTYNQDSDVDLIIVYKSDANIETTKIYTQYKKLDFEIYERTLENLYNRVDQDFLNYEDTLLSAIGYGKILEDRSNKLKKLQCYVLHKYEKGLPKASKEDNIYEAKSLQKSITYLNKMNTKKSPYYEIFFSITLDKIRNYYNRKNGFSNMSTSKVYKLYTDEIMQKVQHKFMPEKHFIDLYLKCIKTKKNEDIDELFRYVIRDIENIDFNNLKIKIGNRKH